MLNIVIPMAGKGSRFASAGFALPKPLIEVHDRPMIRLVIENLRPATSHRFIFLCLRDHVERYGLHQLLSDWAPGCEIVLIDEVTQGAACTVLLSKRFIDNQDGLMIANSDQWVDIDINDYIAAADATECDGLIMTMYADHPKWSYVGLDSVGRVNRVIEKMVISNEATVGIYNFKYGRDFVLAAESMIARDERVNGEFYVAPVYNELIARGMAIDYFNVGQVGGGMFGLGVPEDLAIFCQSPASRRATAG